MVTVRKWLLWALVLAAVAEALYAYHATTHNRVVVIKLQALPGPEIYY